MADSLGAFYSRKVGETQREIQRLERERQRLVGIPEHAYINLELPRGADDSPEVERRAAEVELAANQHRDELLRLTIEVLKLQDRLGYYRQLEAIHAEGPSRGPS